MPRPSHPPWRDNPNNIWWSTQVMKLLIMQSYPVSRHFLPLRSKYSPQPPVLKHSQSMFILYCVRTNFHTHTKQHVKLTVEAGLLNNLWMKLKWGMLQGNNICCLTEFGYFHEKLRG
jgi:hypothetical protein